MKYSFSSTAVLAAVLVSCVSVQAETVLHLPFGKKEELAKWTICCWKSRKGTRPEIRKDADGSGFLRPGSAPKGLLLPLPKPVTFSNELKKVRLSVEIRLENTSRPVRATLALTSRETPVVTLRPFHPGVDSGIVASGYQYNGNFSQHQANYIQARRGAMCVKALSGEGKNGFLKPVKTWQKWILEYDGQQNVLSLKTDTADTAAELHHVKLAGETMRGLWLSGDLDFRNVRLEVEK